MHDVVQLHCREFVVLHPSNLHCLNFLTKSPSLPAPIAIPLLAISVFCCVFTPLPSNFPNLMPSLPVVPAARGAQPSHKPDWPPVFHTVEKPSDTGFHCVETVFRPPVAPFLCQSTALSPAHPPAFPPPPSATLSPAFPFPFLSPSVFSPLPATLLAPHRHLSTPGNRTNLANHPALPFAKSPPPSIRIG